MSKNHDLIWNAIRKEAQEEMDKEPLAAPFLQRHILNQLDLESALAILLSAKLDNGLLEPVTIEELFREAFAHSDTIGGDIRLDLSAIFNRDPACQQYLTPVLYYKGFHALTGYRIANWFWHEGRQVIAHLLQSRITEVFAVDIHPAAKIGHGILIDHATSVVIGETAVVENDVSILHEVTLGGTGKEQGDRHPKIGKGVLIGAGAKLLGNIKIGEGAKIGAGSVVLEDVPSHCTAAGVPAKVTGKPRCENPAFEMNHQIDTGGGI